MTIVERTEPQQDNPVQELVDDYIEAARTGDQSAIKIAYDKLEAAVAASIRVKQTSKLPKSIIRYLAKVDALRADPRQDFDDGSLSDRSQHAEVNQSNVDVYEARLVIDNFQYAALRERIRERAYAPEDRVAITSYLLDNGYSRDLGYRVLKLLEE